MIRSSSGTNNRAKTPVLDQAASLADGEFKGAKQLEQLNDRLTNYVENVRFLEAENRRLEAELAQLRARIGEEGSGLRKVYEKKIHDINLQITQYQTIKNDLEAEINRLRNDLNDMVNRCNISDTALKDQRETIKNQSVQIASLESENSQVKRYIPELQKEIKRLEGEINRLHNELQLARKELNKARPQYDQEVKKLTEEIYFQQTVHKQEMADMQTMLESQPSNNEIFKRELADAVREIRKEYERLAHENRAENEKLYKQKIDDFRKQFSTQEKSYIDEIRHLQTEYDNHTQLLEELQSENSNLANQIKQVKGQLGKLDATVLSKEDIIRQLQAEIQDIMQELHEIAKAKQALDAEITLYRKILDVEEVHAEKVIKEANKRQKGEISKKQKGFVRPQMVPDSEV